MYDSDPVKNPDATRYDAISFTDAIAQQLKVLDSTAFSLCMDNSKPIIVFDMMAPDNIRKALIGERIGTIVSSKDALERESLAG